MLCVGMKRESTTHRAARASLLPCCGALALLAGCGSTAPRSVAPPATPAAQRQQVTRDRVVLRGDVAPEEYGPLRLDGRYRVAFVQRGAGVDFATEVPFTAHLEEAGTPGAPRQRKLFERAAQTGTTTVAARGRWRVVVDFGDSPFELTLTRLPGA